MSTHASIAKLEKDGTVTSIYCHFDGDINTVGRILFDNYKKEEEVDKLLSMGDASSLGASIDPPEAVARFGFSPIFSKEFDALPQTERERLKEDLYNFEHCTFYMRDRDEDTPPQKYSSIREWFETAREEYNYLFDTDGQWKYVTHRGRIKQIHLTNMSDVLETE